MKSQHERISDLEKELEQVKERWMESEALYANAFNIMVEYGILEPNGAVNKKSDCACGGQCGCGPTYKQTEETK